jgi:DNA-binding LacI/PurR family transcriptional regulator
MPGLLSASRFNGAIITNTLPDDDAFLRSTTLPYAVVVQGRRLPNYCCVLETPGKVGRSAAEILVQGGRKRPIVLLPPLLTETTADRATAFCAGFKEQTGYEPQRIVARDFGPSAAADAVTAHLGMDRRCDGLFAVTDTLAPGAYRAIKLAGRRVGEDVATIGVGDSENVDFFDPPLTCVGPAYDEVGAHVVMLLFNLMSRRRVHPAEVFVSPTITRRGSA